MLSLDDPHWGALTGGYRLPYDPRPALQRLSANWNDSAAWEELCNELHHQGDVGEASYAAVSVLADVAARVPVRGWQAYALVATIESERHAVRNPPLPEWLQTQYSAAWSELLRLALEDLRVTQDPLVVRTALAVVALAKGAVKLGVLIADLDESELAAMLEESHAWTEHYRASLAAPISRHA